MSWVRKEEEKAYKIERVEEVNQEKKRNVREKER